MSDLLALMLADTKKRCLLGPWRLPPIKWLLTMSIEWKPQDLWIGAFWKATPFDGFTGYSVWICLIPCLPLHVWWYVVAHDAMNNRGTTT